MLPSADYVIDRSRPRRRFTRAEERVWSFVLGAVSGVALVLAFGGGW